ncbi:MAG: YetF domain-containing protein [Armatimonadota bacterium]|jgi:uncharacterized membrane protein YcaP (DUF421 family)
MWHVSLPVWEFAIRGIVVYAAVLLLLRLGGKRQIGQMGAGEFVAILLISNAVQNAMNGGDNSITGGLVLATVIILFSVSFAYMAYRSKRFENFIQGTPTLLIHNGRLIQKNMEKELMNQRDIKIILRRQGIHEFQDVAEAVLESDGSVSVTRKSDLIHEHPADNASPG